MEWDLGIVGLLTLAGLAALFAIVAQVVAWRVTRWMWLVGGLAYFIGGLFVSEVLFAGATEQEIQPVIDGLAFDEAMLFSLIPGIAAVVVAWLVVRRGHLTGLSASGRGPAPLTR